VNPEFNNQPYFVSESELLLIGLHGVKTISKSHCGQ
jgi:hypothetical protein